MEITSLAGVVIGILLGFKLMGYTMVWLAGEFNIDKDVLPYLAFGLVFAIVVILVSLLGKSLKSIVNKGFLGTLDGAAGSVLGIFRAAFMISVILWIIDSLRFSLPDNWIAESYSYKMVANLAPDIAKMAGQVFPFFKDVF